MHYVSPLFVLWLMLSSTVTLAQTFTVWQGRLVDQQTKEPLPFVNIFVANRQLGTSANAEGDFILKVPNVTEADTVAFSFVGYNTYRLPLLKLANDAPNLVIPLKRAVTTLNEVVVRSIDAKELVRRVIRNVSKNYPNKPVLFQGFYREWVRERPYLVYAEGQLELYKSSYQRAKSDEVRMLKGRQKPLLPYLIIGTDTCLIPTITNGPYLGILLDVVKTTDENKFLHLIGMNQYTYSYAGMSSVDGRGVYIIEFAPHPDRVGANFEGKLFVDRQRLAIVRAEYELSTHGLAQANYSLTVSRLPVRLQRRRYSVDYLRQGDRWFLQHAQASNEYRYITRKIAPITSQMDFIVTKTVREKVKRFNENEILRLDHAFAEDVREFDDSFWGDENIMAEEKK